MSAWGGQCDRGAAFVELALMGIDGPASPRPAPRPLDVYPKDGCLAAGASSACAGFSFLLRNLSILHQGSKSTKTRPLLWCCRTEGNGGQHREKISTLSVPLRVRGTAGSWMATAGPAWQRWQGQSQLDQHCALGQLPFCQGKLLVCCQVPLLTA